MTLARWSPSSDFTSLQRDINRLLGDFLTPYSARYGVSSGLYPPIEVEEEADKFVLRAELPGVAAEDVNITFQDSTLTIRGEKKDPQQKEGTTLHIAERVYGSFSRSITLPAAIESDQIEATVADGVLIVTLFKAAEARPRSIEVKVKR